MAEMLLGRPAADAIREKLALRVAALAEKGVTPRLAVIRLGEDPGDMAYERSIRRGCEKLGCAAESISLPADCTQETLIAQLEKVNADDAIHGCLLLRPLPKHMDSAAVCDALKPEKDLDGMGVGALGALFAGRKDAFAPCTAQACMEMLKFYGIDPAGKRAAVVGRSLVIGRPVAQQLLQADATVTLCHSRTPDLAAVCREADILIAAVGHAGLIGAGHTRPGQVILDVGVNSVDGKLCGDVRTEEAAAIAAAVSPVPGGVGAVTPAVLLAHLVEAAERQTQNG
ncbi:MAG: bifunctional 5,10-methylene-tetrahydrofolate dehydrogenase/5,10-methylene-tetrahydrofolate cyclohydrolase [Oscillospiraceae bacterium]|nr:bifunctional 5,10-methylene-tetrahydrofolate dehydrogenase/5,10-methylene-tetrahydrofolate cyclohydrolase [Oscillospiraceae bacterium]